VRPRRPTSKDTPAKLAKPMKRRWRVVLPHLEMVHRLDHQREAVRPVIAASSDEPDADGISPRHKAIAVVLNLMNPVCAGRWTVGR
jgi:hypothetical protein